MTQHTFRTLGAAIAALCCLSACNLALQPSSNNNSSGNSNDTNDTGNYTPPADYPKGPYGVVEGSVIADLTFLGTHDPAADLNNVVADAADIHLSDYRHKVPVLLLTAAAGWCEYCNMEEPSVVSFYNSTNASSQKFGALEILINDKTLGQPANMTFVEDWASMYSVTFDMGIDPQQVLNPYYQQDALPMHTIITTADMVIQYQFEGEDDTMLTSVINSFVGCATLDSTSACNSN